MLSQTKIEKWYFFIGLYGRENHQREETDDLEEPGLDATADAITDPLEAVRIIKRYEETIQTQIKRAIGYAGKQEQLFKQFRENVGQSKFSTYFKMVLHKFLKKYPLKHPHYLRIIS